jgi:hypothetical protein
MALFPEYDEIAYVPGIEITPRFSTSISALSGGQEKRRAKFTFPLYDLKISYELLTLADARTIWQFYKDRQGMFGSFYFYLPYLETFEGEYCGTGDGAEDLFDVPGKTITSYTVYVGAVPVVEGGGNDYVIEEDAGLEYAARINFAVAPSVGDHITIDFTGYYRFKVRFEEDNLPFDVFAQKLVKMGISLVGVR